MKTLKVLVVVAIIPIQAGLAQQQPIVRMTKDQAIAAIKRIDEDISADENRVSLQMLKNLTSDSLVPLHSLPKLQELMLSWSNVDDAGLSHAKGLKQLKILGLDASKITDAGLVNLKDMVDLKELSLEQTKIGSKGLESIKGLTKLEYLNLERTKTDDAGMAHLKGLVKLKDLNLTFTKITGKGLVHLRKMTDLENLELCYTNVDSQGLEHLKGMTKLEYLRLFNSKVDDRGMVYLSGLTNLKDLSLHCTDISDAGLIHLKGLKQLTGLTLNGTNITDAGLVHLEGLTKLEVLFLNDRVTNSGMKKLKAILPNCEMGRYDEETNKVTLDIDPKQMKEPDSPRAKKTDQPPAKTGGAKPESVLRAPRIWTDFTGNFKLEARFTRMDGGYVVFQRADNGREFRLTMGTLSKDDRAFLERELGMTSKSEKAPKKIESAPDVLKQTRTWSDSTGKFSIKARFVELVGKSVVLERDDNRKKIRILLDRLSKADQLFIKSQNETNNKKAMPKKDAAKKYPRTAKSGSSSRSSTRRNAKSKFRVRSDGVLALAGFNSRKGVGIEGRVRGAYPLDTLNRQGGAKEFGWSGPWPASPKATFQTQTVFEGDGALHLAGTANYGRNFAGPLTGVIEIEQYVLYPKGGNLTCYIWEKNSTNCGPMWRLEKGRFRTLDGDGRGSGKWIDTGITSGTDEWTKVVIKIDNSKKRWKLTLPGKNYVSPELKYRGVPKQLLMINYLTETQPGIFVDAVQVRQAKQD